ncbi:MAG: hypothetical protein AAGC74_07085 [Verrucomicrobiota bacterium]
MKNNAVAFIALWLISLAGAFFAGQALSSSTAKSSASQETATKSTNSLAGPSGSSATAPTNRAASARARLASSAIISNPDAAPAELLLDIISSEDPIARTNALIALIDTLSPDDFENTVHAFRQLGITDERRAEYALLLSAWAKTDPLAALTYAKENTGGTFARNTILATWASSNPDAALAWARDNFDGEEGEANPWLVGVIRGLAPNDLARATQLLESLPRSDARGNGLDSILTMLMARNTDSAKDWSTSISDPVLRSGAYAFTAEAIARKDAPAAAQWLSELGDSEAIRRVGEDLAEEFYEQDPQAATEWALSLPPENIPNAAEGIVDRMVEESPVQAAQWLSNLMTENPDANYEGAVQEIVRGARRSDPQVSAEWISAMDSERNRTRSYHWVLGEWSSRDKQAATNWIQANQDNLPATVRTRFIDGQN